MPVALVASAELRTVRNAVLANDSLPSWDVRDLHRDLRDDDHPGRDHRPEIARTLGISRASCREILQGRRARARNPETASEMRAAGHRPC